MDRRSFIIVLAAVLVAAGVMLTFISADDLDEMNPFWNGLSSVTQEFHVQDVTAATIPERAGNTVLLLFAKRPAGASDASALRAYLARGGNIILADDFGSGNQYVEDLGLAVRFYGEPLLDPLFDAGDASLPRIRWYRTGGLNSFLVLNRATALINVEGAEILAWSTVTSFIDSNRSRTLDEGEPAGPLPVAARVNVGAGQVVVLSNASLFINSMLPADDNMSFLRSLVGSGKLLLYTPSLPSQRTATMRRALDRGREALAFPPLLVLISAVIIIAIIGYDPLAKKARDHTHWRPLWLRGH